MRSKTVSTEDRAEFLFDLLWSGFDTEDLMVTAFLLDRPALYPSDQPGNRMLIIRILEWCNVDEIRLKKLARMIKKFNPNLLETYQVVWVKLVCPLDEVAK